MKKLNRKGFTLVELLAVIIILAIVVGITIPAVLTTTSKAKEKAFETAATSAADWVERQYQALNSSLGSSGLATIDPAFTAACGADGGACKVSSGTGNSQKFGKVITDSAFITATGLSTSNVEKMVVYIGGNGGVCVALKAVAGADYDYGQTTKEMRKGRCNVDMTKLKF